MTNMILGVIGIVLAAAATLVVMNYGGDYYVDAHNDGDSMNLENALANVYTAYGLHEMKVGSAPGELADMLDDGSGTLDFVPSLGGGMVFDEDWSDIEVDGVSRRVATISNVPSGICLSMNLRTGKQSRSSCCVGAHRLLFNAEWNEGLQDLVIFSSQGFAAVFFHPTTP